MANTGKGRAADSPGGSGSRLPVFQNPAVADSTQALRPLPLIHRVRFKNGLILTMLVLLAMTLITLLQIRETMREIERGAVEKGRTVAQAVAPLVIAALHFENIAGLKPYFRTIESAKDIDYVQVVDSDGRVIAGNEPLPGERRPLPLKPGWLMDLPGQKRLDRRAAAVPWPNNEPGVDVFVALLDPDREAHATAQTVLAARHLRIGVNFDDVMQQDLPRVIWRMLFMTLAVTAGMLAAMWLWLSYLLRPVRALHAGLREVAAGNLEYQVPVYSRDEVGRLLQAFNATTARLRAAFLRIEELAIRDALTNLHNRRIFDEGLSAEAARSRRYGHPFGLIILDIDHFKAINDAHGHPAGDDVLRAVAQAIDANIRETDLSARIGGEEFAVVLPESQPDEIVAVAEKLRAAVEQARFETAHGLPEGLRVTISAGAACSLGYETEPEALLAKADAALYQSKNAGRNRVTMA